MQDNTNPSETNRNEATGSGSSTKLVRIRPAILTDKESMIIIADASGLFPSDELEEIGGMLADYFTNQPDNDHHWIIAEDDFGPVGLAYYAPERMTYGTWNIYLIAVHPARQGEGHGAPLLRYIEQTLTKRHERILLVETSGLASFEPTRAFYRKCGYTEEARIRDFYKAGEDKIIFYKALSVQ